MLSVPTGPSACWQLPAELAPAGGASIIPEPSGGGGPGVGSLRDPSGPSPARAWEARDPGRCAGEDTRDVPGHPADAFGHQTHGRPAVLARVPSLASVSPSGQSSARAETQLHIPRPQRSPLVGYVWVSPSPQEGTPGSSPGLAQQRGGVRRAGGAAQDPDRHCQWASGVPPGREAPGWGHPVEDLGPT